MRRKVRWSADYIQRQLGGKAAMLTLTYRDADAWEPNHVKECIRHIRQWMKRKGHVMRYVWVAELQERGAVHYHVLIWLPKGLTIPKPDKQGWWPHGSTNIKWAKHAVGYIVKYASKLRSKCDQEFPKGLRLCDSGGLDETGRIYRAWTFLPRWMRDLCTPEMKVTRAKGGGFFSRTTGEEWETPWAMCGWTFVPGVGRVVMIRQKWSYLK